MNIKALLPWAFSTACLAAAGAGGCVEDVEDCVQICDDYDACRNASFDRGACVDQCENRADFDEAFRIAAQNCEECLDTGSCDEQADSCTVDCFDVINAST